MRSRAEVRARHRLLIALYHGRRRAAEIHAARLERMLGTAAAGDADLEVARGWIAEAERRPPPDRAETRRTSLKLVLTAAPLLLAALLAGLLMLVLLSVGSPP